MAKLLAKSIGVKPFDRTYKYIVVELIPQRQSHKFRTRKPRNGGEIEAINGQADQIRMCRETAKEALGDP